MKYTLLEIVQEILSDMDSDEVNSIDDTVESQQVASIVRSAYMALMSNRNWAHLRKLVNLVNSTTPAQPTHMYLESPIKEMVYVNYNCVKPDQPSRRIYQTMKWLEPDAFLRRQNSLNSDLVNVDVIQDPTGIELLIRNDKNPEYFTSFDDNALVFDSYLASVESTIQSSKVQACAYVMPTWTHLDDAVPDLPDEAFTLLIEEAKSRAMLRLKQVADQKSEQEARRQNQWLSRKQWRVNGGVKYPDYGRRSRKGPRDKTFERND